MKQTPPAPREPIAKISVLQAVQTLRQLEREREQIALGMDLLSKELKAEDYAAASTLLHAGQIDLDQNIKALNDRLNRSVLAE